MFLKNKEYILPLLIAVVFFGLYSTLALVKHAHFLSGYDLAVSDQGIWKYSQFQAPITTIHTYYDTSILEDHVELIFIFLVPFYWVYNNTKTFLILQVFIICSAIFPVYFLAREKKLSIIFSSVIALSFISFYGIQFAIWNDAHSLMFGVAALAFYIYFSQVNKMFLSFLFLILAIISKEDLAFLTGGIAFIFLLTSQQKKWYLLQMAISGLYLFFIFGIYFPYLTRDGYRFEQDVGYFSHLSPTNFFDTNEKRDSLFYSFAWYGFLPLGVPLYVIPAMLDFAHYFLLGSAVKAAQEIFLHYRSSLSILLVWPTIIAISKYKFLQKKFIVLYLLFWMGFVQYQLHLPLSYLTKQWFWEEPQSVQTIKQMIQEIPQNEAIVTQVNITPHVSHREDVYTLWPTTREFADTSICQQQACQFAKWGGNPKYLLIDLSNDWDIRHTLANHEDFISSLQNLEKTGVITIVKELETTRLYKINNNPNQL